MDNNAQLPAQAEAESKAQACKHIPIIIVLVLLLICAASFAIVEYVMMTQKKEPIAEQTTEPERKPEPSAPESKVTPDSGQPAEPDEKSDDQSYITIKVRINAKHGFNVLKKCTSTDNGCWGSGYAATILDKDFQADEEAITFFRYNSYFGGISPTKSIEQEFNFDGEVTRAMVGLFGNGGNEAILLQFSDGTVGAIYLDYKNMTFKAISRLEGISGVTALYDGYEDDGAQVFAIDASGNATGLYDKIWKN